MRRNDRLRGRLDPGDPRSFGFSLRVVFAPDLAAAHREHVLGELACQVLDPASLETAGSLHGECFEGFVVRPGDSVTGEDRRALDTWLRTRPEVKEFTIGSLVEAGRTR